MSRIVSVIYDYDGVLTDLIGACIKGTDIGIRQIKRFNIVENNLSEEHKKYLLDAFHDVNYFEKSTMV